MSMESNVSFRSYQIILEQKQWGIKETCKHSPRATAMAFWSCFAEHFQFGGLLSL